MEAPPQAIQGRINDLLRELEGWRRGTLSGQFSPGALGCRQAEREHLFLQMHYRILLLDHPYFEQSAVSRTRVTILRPSTLTSPRLAWLQLQVVAPARALTGLFPDKLDLMFVYVKAPW